MKVDIYKSIKNINHCSLGENCNSVTFLNYETYDNNNIMNMSFNIHPQENINKYYERIAFYDIAG